MAGSKAFQDVTSTGNDVTKRTAPNRTKTHSQSAAADAVRHCLMEEVRTRSKYHRRDGHIVLKNRDQHQGELQSCSLTIRLGDSQETSEGTGSTVTEAVLSIAASNEEVDHALVNLLFHG